MGAIRYTTQLHGMIFFFGASIAGRVISGVSFEYVHHHNMLN